MSEAYGISAGVGAALVALTVAAWLAPTAFRAARPRPELVGG